MTFRKNYISRYIFSWAKGVLPALSNTEREAIEAGDVWWDADLFTGNPDWAKLLADARRPNSPRKSKRSWTGRSNELCGMLDDWQINLGAARLAARGLGIFSRRTSSLR